MNKITDKIDHLLTNYSFDELSAEDQALVRLEMTESEYRQMYALVSGTADLSRTALAMPIGLHENIKDILRQRRVTHITNWWIPALIGMLLGAMMMGSYFFWVHTDTEDAVVVEQLPPNVLTDTIRIIEKDTVYLTIQSKPKIITKEIIKYIQKEIPSAPSPALPLALQTPPLLDYSASNSFHGNYFNNIDLADIIPLKLGKTVGEEEELMNLLTEMSAVGFE